MKTIYALTAAAALTLAASAANAQSRDSNLLDPLGIWGGQMEMSDQNFPAGPPSKTIAGSNEFEWEYE